MIGWKTGRNMSREWNILNQSKEHRNKALTKQQPEESFEGRSSIDGVFPITQTRNEEMEGKWVS